MGGGIDKFSIPPWKLIRNCLIVEPLDVARQIARVPFYKMSTEFMPHPHLIFGNFLIASAEPLYSGCICQLVTLEVDPIVRTI